MSGEECNNEERQVHVGIYFAIITERNTSGRLLAVTRYNNLQDNEHFSAKKAQHGWIVQ